MDSCRATNRQGARCANRPMKAQAVCRIHGGASPQALAKAEERMRALVHPSISRLGDLVDEGEFSAIRYVLDWAGFKAADKVEGDQQITITVKREEPVPLVLERTIEHRLTNGHNGTHD